MPVRTENKTNGHQTNGVLSSPSHCRFSFNPDDPSYVKDLQRPAVIKEDLNEMERRKRVHQILESKTFREELENLIVSERQQGHNVESLRTLEKLSELISPISHLQLSSVFSNFSNPQSAVPIADLRGAESAKYSVQERLCRNKLAALYRLIDLFQWSQGIYNHSTLRLSSQLDQVLINPFGLLYHEITASALVKLDLDGRVLDAGSTSLGINQAGYVLHSAIHAARRDLRCVVHLHTPVVAAVAAMKCGLLPISHDALLVGPVSYHDYQGVLNDAAERQSIVDDLGPINKVLFLRNHGFVVCGTSLEETLLTLLHLVSACETQVRATKAGIEQLIVPSEAAQLRMAESIRDGVVARSGGGAKWRPGELEWEAWMRVLDSAGCRTGHVYRQSCVARSRAPAAQSDVEVPPAASAFGLLPPLDEADGAPAVGQARRDHVRWLNSPNVYQRVEFEETGTSEPKKLTKWVQDEASPAHSTAVKIDSAHYFSPLSASNKEFKERQKAIKENRRGDSLTAGPQSKLLEGVGWQEAGRLQDAELSGAAQQERVLIGAASQGIIEREFRHNAQIYRQLYQPNPFVSATDDDIRNYVEHVRRRHAAPATAEHDEGTESPESVSLMQAARDFERQKNDLVIETTFDADTNNVVSVTTVPKAGSRTWFRRSKSARYPAQLSGTTNSGANDGKALSDDDTRENLAGASQEKKETKRKKFKTPSIFKNRKDKEKKK